MNPRPWISRPTNLWIAGDNRVQSDVAIFPRFGGKRDVTHLIYVNIKPYHFLLFWQRRRVFKFFPQQKVSDEIKFQNAIKRQIKIIYFYVIKTPLYTIIAGDSQTHIISILGLGRRLYRPSYKGRCRELGYEFCIYKVVMPLKYKGLYNNMTSVCIFIGC